MSSTVGNRTFDKFQVIVFPEAGAKVNFARRSESTISDKMNSVRITEGQIGREVTHSSRVARI